MESFEDLLLREQSNKNIGIVTFFATDVSQDSVIVFVEGVEDVPFYYDFLESYFESREIVYIDCGGKAGVHFVCDYFQGYDFRLSPHKILYLCDKDFYPWFGEVNKKVYQTDLYSIESYFGSVEYLDYLLRKFCNKECKVKFRKKIIQYARALWDGIVRKVRVTMAIACALRVNQIDFDFDQLQVRNIVKFDLDRVVRS